MKGVPGILLALGLGLAGAVCNWFYLERLAGKQARVSFIGIEAGTQLNSGEVIRDEHIVRVDIPRPAIGGLDQVAPLWSVRSTVVGQKTNRSYRGGEIVLLQDLQTIGVKDLNEKLGANEVAMWLPVDPRTFVASRVNPEDEVSFVVPHAGGVAPSPTPLNSNQPTPASGNEIIGPFRILEIGSRTGRPEVQRIAGTRMAAETSLTIVAPLINGKLDPKVERILEVMRTTRSQGLQVLLYPRKRE